MDNNNIYNNNNNINNSINNNGVNNSTNNNDINNNPYMGMQQNPESQTGSYMGTQSASQTEPYMGTQSASQTEPYMGTQSASQTEPYTGTQSAPYSQVHFENVYNRTAAQSTKHVKKNGGFGVFMGKTVVAALVFGLVGGGIFTGVSYAGSKVVTASTTSDATLFKADSSDSKVKQTATGEASDLTDVSGVVEEVMPSIVAITNTSTVTYNSFFGRQSQSSQSCGSGIIVSEDSEYLYIATNNHVVSDSEELTVQFNDDSVVKAEIRGTDPDDDLAVVRVKKSDMGTDTYAAIKIATIGDSDGTVVGSPAIAIGNALGYGQSVTTGIVSALNRTVTTQDSYTGETVTNNSLIQTDAAINPGNSGGALLNENGEVIGINSVKYSSTEVEGIGYAIPMSVAQPVIESLIKNGEYVNENAAYLGIKGGDVSAEMLAYGFPEGVYVSSVISGSGADEAGIEQGDIITAVNGEKISAMTQLQNTLKSYSAGDTVTLTVARQSGRQYENSQIEVILSSASQVQ